MYGKVTEITHCQTGVFAGKGQACDDAAYQGDEETGRDAGFFSSLLHKNTVLFLVNMVNCYHNF